MRATLDANVVASGAIGYRRDASAPGAILRLWLSGAFDLITSDHINDEVGRTLDDPWFVPRLDPVDRALLVDALNRRATRTPLTTYVSGVATHAEDDLVLATAVSGEADYLVTGDRQLQKLGSYRGVRIRQPARVPRRAPLGARRGRGTVRRGVAATRPWRGRGLPGRRRGT